MGPTAELHIASAAILALVFVYATLGYRARRTRHYRLFAALCVTACFAVAIELACAFLSSQAGTLAAETAIPLRIAVVVLQCAAANLLFSYTAVLCRGDEPLRAERIIITSIPCCLAIIATISSFATEAVIRIDETGAVATGSLYLAMRACMAFYPLICLIYSFAYRKMLRPLDSMAIRCAALILLTCLALDAVLGYCHLVTFGLAMAALSVFVTAGSPLEFVDSLTHAYDAAAFRAHAADLIKHHRRFSVVIVTLRHMATLNAILGSSATDEAIRLCVRSAMRVGRTRQVYRIRSSAFAFMTFSRHECRRVTSNLAELFSKPQFVGASSVDLDIAVAATSSLDVFDTAEDVTQYVNFLVEKIQVGIEIPENQQSLTGEFQRKREVRRYLVHAVENDLVRTYAQPIYSFKKERFCSFEVLSRLIHPELGKIPADEFIEAAESERLIAQLGRDRFDFVCRFASQHATELADAGITSIKINLSPIELMEAGFAEATINTMRRWNMAPSLFQFEITETASTRYGAKMENAIKELCRAGSKLCMDDFGSGFANLDSILNLPFKVMKIDKTLLDNAVNDDSAAALYRSVVEMIARQGLSTVAEGVETAEQDKLIRALGIDEAQGYFYAKPIPIEDIFATIQQSDALTESSTQLAIEAKVQ